MLTLVPVGLGFATLAIIIVQATAALAVVVYFRRRRKRDPRWWSTFIAPGFGFIFLAGFSVMAIVNFTIVAGSDAIYVQLLPWLLVVAVVGGLGYAWFLRARRPDVYRGLDDDLERFTDRPDDKIITSGKPNGQPSDSRR